MCDELCGENGTNFVRLLIITNHFWPEDFQINDLAFELASRGHQVTVLSSIPNYPHGRFYDGYGIFRRRREVHRGVTIHRIPVIPRGAGRRRNLILNYVSSAISFCLHAVWFGRKKYDATFVFNTSPATIAFPAIVVRTLYGTPHVMWVLDLWPESVSATSAVNNRYVIGMLRGMMRFIYRRCDRLLISSRGFRKHIDDVGGYEGDMVYLPNWVSTPAEAPSSIEPVGVPALPQGFRIVFTGNIGAAQDFPTVLDAAERLTNYPDIHWLIVGDGRKAEEVAMEVSRRGLEKQVHLLGRFPASTMTYFYDRADVLLLPLRDAPIFRITVPRKLQAYMASGKPIIAAIDGEGSDLVRESQAGVCCPAADPRRLAEAVKSLYEMPVDRRREMGRRGQEFAHKHFDRDTIVRFVEDLLQSMHPNRRTVRDVRERRIA